MPRPGTTESHDVRCIILSKQEHATHFELVLNVLLFVNRRCPHNPRTLNYWIDEDPFPFSYSSTYWDSWKVVEHHEIQCAKIGFSFPSERVIYLENNYASIAYGQFFISPGDLEIPQHLGYNPTLTLRNTNLNSSRVLTTQTMTLCPS